MTLEHAPITETNKAENIKEPEIPLITYCYETSAKAWNSCPNSIHLRFYLRRLCHANPRSGLARSGSASRHTKATGTNNPPKAHVAV
jgi:hypothetical protein